MQILLTAQPYHVLCSHLLSCIMLFFLELIIVLFFSFAYFSRVIFQCLSIVDISLSVIFSIMQRSISILPWRPPLQRTQGPWHKMHWLFPTLLDQLSFLDFLSDPVSLGLCIFLFGFLPICWSTSLKTFTRKGKYTVQILQPSYIWKCLYSILITTGNLDI